MDYFKLTWRWRFVLAVASGVLPTILFMFVGERVSVNLLSSYFAPYGAFLGMLVMVPFIAVRRFRVARILLMVIAGSTLVGLTIFAGMELSWSYGVASIELLLSVLVGTVLISITTVLIAALKISVRLVVHAAIAGFVSGLVFNFMLENWEWLCFDDCKWWNDWLFAGAWVFWHVSIFAAFFRGAKFGRSARFDAAPANI